MTERRAPMTIQQQADFLDYLAGCCIMRDGSVAGRASLVLTDENVEDLRAISTRLHRMAPHEAEIKKLVQARR